MSSPSPAPASVAAAPAPAPARATQAPAARKPETLTRQAVARKASAPVKVAAAAPVKAVPLPRVAALSKAAPLPKPTPPSAPAPEPAPAAPPVAAAAPTPPAPEPAPVPAPFALPPTVAVATVPASTSNPSLFLPDDFAGRADTLLNEHLPRLAQRAERQVLRALHAAAEDANGMSDAEVLSATRAMHVGLEAPLTDIPLANADARRLHEAAGAAFWNSRNPLQALNLQMRAFGANPLDAEVAGNLAYYFLKQRPASPEVARRLALYALTLRDSPFPHGRIEDWTTFAIASALVGRERDARNAFFLTLALSPSLERQCRAAASAYASHGTPLRAPTEAMLARIRTWGRSGESPFCRWPPNWWVGVKAP